MSPRASKSADDDEDVVDDLGPQFEEAAAESPAGPEEEAPASTTKRAAKKSKPGIVLEKPRANVYTVLLILTFVALVIGCAFLYGELARYDWKLKPPR